MDPTAIATATASRLRVTPADTQPAADAAVAYIAVWCNVPAGELPDETADPLAWQGAVLLCERIFQDTGVPSGAQSVFGDAVLTGAVVPENLARHLHHYWQHLQRLWGVA